MQPNEKKSATSIALLMSFRMLGLFMILPVFTVYAHKLHGATPKLIGIALGIYGLTQACLQILFGLLSDKIGRKPVIFIGLMIFALGSALAALSHSIEGVIIGRALQGGGAVGSVLIALLADLTSDENRTKAMAILGMSIGFSFAVAMVVGPAINSIAGVSGIFWLTAIMAMAGIMILFFVIPDPKTTMRHSDAEPVPAMFKKILTHGELLRLDLGIFIQHGVLTATFVALPVALTHYAGLNTAHQWMLYLPILIFAFIAMVPFIIMAEKKRKMKSVFVSSIVVILLSQLWLWWQHSSLIAFIIGLALFFTAFTLLESTLPSLVSKIAPLGSKGTAMGVYSTSQFLGIFAGGALGGIVYGSYGVAGTFLMCAASMFIWFLAAVSMKKPSHYASKMYDLTRFSGKPSEIHKQLMALPGVEDALVNKEDSTVYLRVDSEIFDEKTILKS